MKAKKTKRSVSPKTESKKTQSKAGSSKQKNKISNKVSYKEDFIELVKNKRVAVIHDWLNGMRGGEKVLEKILELLPVESTEIFTLIKEESKLSDYIKSFPIHTSFIQNLPFAKKKYRSYLPLFPLAIESFSFRDFDLVLSTSHCVAKGVIVPPDVPHISYVHSPMRYVWDLFSDYFDRKKQGFISYKLISMFSNYLRTWDSASASRAELYIANSSYITRRIKKYWGRDAEVVYPPCGTKKQLLENLNNDIPGEDYYLMVSAFAPYKRLDLAVSAFIENGKELIVIGDGQDYKSLKKLSKAYDNITLLGALPWKDIKEYLKRAKGFIYPGIEDFGIALVEAQSYNVPVIAYARGGALENVLDKKTGYYFSPQNREELQKAIENVEKLNLKKQDFSKHVLKFSDENFQENYSRFVSKLLRTIS